MDTHNCPERLPQSYSDGDSGFEPVEKQPSRYQVRPVVIR